MRNTKKKNTKKPEPKNHAIRLNKWLSMAGVCSRRKADMLIKNGEISINNKKVTEVGTKVTFTDTVFYKNKVLRPQKMEYILLNKPKGYITTMSDPKNRKTVMDLIENSVEERVYPVGRLDRNTTGLLLLTNDGDMAKKLLHPSHKALKVYYVELDKSLFKKDANLLLEGVETEEGVVHFDQIHYANKKNCVRVSIHMGKNKVIRRAFASLNYEVKKLDRIYFAGLDKKNLRLGTYRKLTDKEIHRLQNIY